MAPRAYFTLLIFISCIYAYSQKIIVTEGTAQVELLSYKSRMEVEKEAEDLAIINALEKAFGRVVVQGNSTYIKNVSTGEATETNTVFNMIANTSVKGELLEVLDKKYTDIEGEKKIDGRMEKYIVIQCDIKIKAIETKEAKVDFIALPLKCENINCQSTSFVEGDNLFFYFKSPVKGYLSIYLDDGETSQRLLPYRYMPDENEGHFKIEASMEYILFSDLQKYYYFQTPGYPIDTYELYAESREDLSRFFVLFSRSILNDPFLYEGMNDEVLNEREKSYGYTMPNSLPSEDFQKWLNKTRSHMKDDMQVQYIDITVQKP